MDKAYELENVVDDSLPGDEVFALGAAVVAESPLDFEVALDENLLVKLLS